MLIQELLKTLDIYRKENDLLRSQLEESQHQAGVFMFLVDFLGQIRAEKAVASEATKDSSMVAPSLEDLKKLPVISKHPNTMGNYNQGATKYMAVYLVRNVRRLQRRVLGSSESDENDTTAKDALILRYGKPFDGQKNLQLDSIIIQSRQAAVHDANSDGLVNVHGGAECRGP